jgi:hypothetical protein
MPLNQCEIILTNKEGHSDFNISPNWHANRKPGLSAVVRCYGEERWIGPCIKSILPLFDEVLVTLTPKEGDKSEEIVRSIKDPKLRLLIYPFRMVKRTSRTYDKKLQWMFRQAFPGDPSVHSYSYYTNWGMAQTRFSHVSDRWDADMILRPEFATKDFHDFILSKNSVSIRGLNVISDDFKQVSKEWPYQGPEARFVKVDPFRFHYGEGDALSYLGVTKLIYPSRWRQFPVQQAQSLFNNLTRKDVFVRDPVFWHTKFLRELGAERYTDEIQYWKRGWGKTKSFGK